MGTQAVSPYQQVIEKTKALGFKSQMLVMNVEKKLGQKNTESVSIVSMGMSSYCPRQYSPHKLSL